MKGPSAATLYGTNAANGVIVITTKKGRAGPHELESCSPRAARSTIATSIRHTYANWGHCVGTGCTAAELANPVRCSLVTMSAGIRPNAACVERQRHRRPTCSEHGHLADSRSASETERLQVSGGADAVRFFVSGDIENEIGPLKMPRFFARSVSTSTKHAVRGEWIHPSKVPAQSACARTSARRLAQVRPQHDAAFSNTDQRLAAVGQQRQQLLLQRAERPGFIQGCEAVPATPRKCLGYQRFGSLGQDLHGYGGFTPAEIFQRTTTRGRRSASSAPVNANWRPFTWMQNDGDGRPRPRRPERRRSSAASNECPNSGTTRRARSATTQHEPPQLLGEAHEHGDVAGAHVVELQDDGRRATTSNVENDGVERDRHAPAAGRQTRRAAATIARAVNTLPTAHKTLGYYVAGAGGDSRPPVPHGRGAHRPEQRVRHEVPARLLSEGAACRGSSRTRASSRTVTMAQPVPPASRVRRVGRAAGTTTALRRRSRRRSTEHRQHRQSALDARRTLGNPNLKPETSTESETASTRAC